MIIVELPESGFHFNPLSFKLTEKQGQLIGMTRITVGSFINALKPEAPVGAQIVDRLDLLSQMRQATIKPCLVPWLRCNKL